MKWIFVPLLLLVAMSVTADDGYQQGYEAGARMKAYQEGWNAAQKIPQISTATLPQADDNSFAQEIEKRNAIPSFKEFHTAQNEARKLQEKQTADPQLPAEWKATFVPEKGSRTYYAQENGSFKTDESETKLEFEFIVPKNSTRATIRIIGVQVGESDAVILYQSKKMIVISAKDSSSLDKSETYTLYPDIGIGFLNMTRTDVGDNFAKTASKTDANIPTASSITFPLKLKE